MDITTTNLFNKQRQWDMCQQLSHSSAEQLSDVLRSYYHPDVAWHGCAPFNSLQGYEAMLEGFYLPFYHAFAHVRKAPYILMAGDFDGKSWVSLTGNLYADFVNDWLGIPATSAPVCLRFGEFHAMVAGRICESYLLIDIPDLMYQAGIQVFPFYLGQQGVIPAPQRRDGVLLSNSDDPSSQASLKLVEAMIGGLSSYDQNSLTSMAQKQYWHPDMCWYGPHGIGSSRGLAVYERDHQIPFLQAFPDRKGGHHRARFADAHYVCSTGWPSIYATHAGDYLGTAASQRAISMRVMDWWRCDAGVLAENWVFIDMVDLFQQLSVDLLAIREPLVPNTSPTSTGASL